MSDETERLRWPEASAEQKAADLAAIRRSRRRVPKPSSNRGKTKRQRIAAENRAAWLAERRAAGALQRNARSISGTPRGTPRDKRK